jgi:hypothetical protein
MTNRRERFNRVLMLYADKNVLRSTCKNAGCDAYKRFAVPRSHSECIGRRDDITKSAMMKILTAVTGDGQNAPDEAFAHIER